jgi:hypothetical protein
VSKNKKKGQIIKTLTLKWKVKHHYMKRDDGIYIIDKEQNNFLFLFSANKKKAKEMKRTIMFFQHFAFVVWVSKEKSTISISYLLLFFFSNIFFVVLV